MRRSAAKVILWISMSLFIMSITAGVILPGLLSFYAYPASEYEDYENEFYEGPRVNPETRPFRGRIDYGDEGWSIDAEYLRLDEDGEGIENNGIAHPEGSEVVVFVKVHPSWGQMGAWGE
ncbi:MAG: hypothetical protein ACMUHY_08880, partial [Thermoplasmatota archaeon]